MNVRDQTTEFGVRPEGDNSGGGGGSNAVIAIGQNDEVENVPQPHVCNRRNAGNDLPAIPDQEQGLLCESVHRCCNRGCIHRLWDKIRNCTQNWWTLFLFVIFGMASLYTTLVFTMFSADVPKNDLAVIGFMYAFLVLFMLNYMRIYERYIYRYTVLIVLDIFQETIYRDIFTTVVSSCLLCFAIYLCILDMRRIYSLCSMICMVIVAILCNVYYVGNIKWNVIVRCLNLQFILAILFMYVPIGRELVLTLGKGIVGYLKFGEIGSRFVYGNMLIDQFIFAFYILSTLYLSFMTIAILRHFGFIDYLIELSKKLTFWCGCTAVEGTAGMVNTVLSMTETCVVVKGLLTTMKQSELFTLMVTGLSTVSFSALFAYASLGADVDYLIVSCIVTIPTSFAFAKIFSAKLEARSRPLLLPIARVSHEDNGQNEISGNRAEIRMARQRDTEHIYANISEIEETREHAKSLLSKCLDSLTDATYVIQVIIGNLVAIMSFVAVCDKVVEIILRPFLWNYYHGDADYTPPAFGIMRLLIVTVSYVLPLFGVDARDTRAIAEMLVNKVLVNEFAAFQILGQNLGRLASDRSIAFANVALCGFGNISAAGMLTSVITAMSNGRVNTSSMMFKALFVSIFVNIYCACTITMLI